MTTTSTVLTDHSECFGCSAVLGYLIPWLCKWEAVGIEHNSVMDHIKKVVNRSRSMCQGFCKTRLICRLHLKPIAESCDTTKKAIVKWKCPDCYSERNPRRPDMRWVLISNDFECLAISYGKGRKSNWQSHLSIPISLPKTREEALERHTLTSDELVSYIRRSDTLTISESSIALPPLKLPTSPKIPLLTRHEPAPTENVPTPSDIIALSSIAVRQAVESNSIVDNFAAIMTQKFHFRPEMISNKAKGDVVTNSIPSSPVKPKPQPRYFRSYLSATLTTPEPMRLQTDNSGLSIQESQSIKQKLGIAALLNPY